MMDDGTAFLFFFLHAYMACMFPEINIKFMKADNMLRLTLSMPYYSYFCRPESRNDNIGGLGVTI